MVQNLDLYLEYISSFVNDDDKLVTYKWLSKELEVHVNIAKDILQNYYDNHKTEIDATFLIKGQLEDGSLRMEVTRAADLEIAKQKFERLDFQHIYSVQKALPDIEMLATTGNGDVRFSAIKLEKCPLRTENLPASVETSTEKAETKQIDDNAKEKIVKKVEKENKDEKEELKEVEKEKPKAKIESTKSNAKTNKKPVQSTQTGFKNLFGKVANQKKPEIKSTEQQKKPLTPVKEEKKVESPEKSPVKLNTGSKNTKVRTYQNKKRARSPAKKESANKRKRIVVASDSSEDEEMKSGHSDREEAEEIVEPAENPFSRKSPSPEPSKAQNGKVKIRKVVSQSYEDEDGFVLTKQVTVIEEVDAEPEPAPAPKPKKVEPVKAKKQASITSFFKRS